MCCKFIDGIIGMKILVLLWLLDLVVQIFDGQWLFDGLLFNFITTSLGIAFILTDTLKTRKALYIAMNIKIGVDFWMIIKYFWLIGSPGYSSYSQIHWIKVFIIASLVNLALNIHGATVAKRLVNE